MRNEMKRREQTRYNTRLPLQREGQNSTAKRKRREETKEGEEKKKERTEELTERKEAKQTMWGDTGRSPRKEKERPPQKEN